MGIAPSPRYRCTLNFVVPEIDTVCYVRDERRGVKDKEGKQKKGGDMGGHQT